jgi:hypothetical protein
MVSPTKSSQKMRSRFADESLKLSLSRLKDTEFFLASRGERRCDELCQRVLDGVSRMLGGVVTGAGVLVGETGEREGGRARAGEGDRAAGEAPRRGVERVRRGAERVRFSGILYAAYAHLAFNARAV